MFLCQGMLQNPDDAGQTVRPSALMSCRRGVKERVQAQTSRFHGVRLNKRTKKWEVSTFRLPCT